MKKFLVFMMICISFGYQNTFANTPTTGASGAGGSGNGTMSVTVSEDLSQLGIPCSKKGGYYECSVEQGFSPIQTMLGSIIQYATFLIALVGVLYIVIYGIIYSIGAEDKSSIKDKIFKAIGGLILLLLSGVILNAIAPWVYSV